MHDNMKQNTINMQPKADDVGFDLISAILMFNTELGYLAGKGHLHLVYYLLVTVDRHA